MATFGVWEWALILIIVILIFGAGRLPKIGKGLGEAVNEFQKALQGDQEQPRDQEESSEE
jgi:sec-independent protein translocase protein TatA